MAAIVEEGDFPTNARIKCGEASKVRDEASDCHSSQLGGMVGRGGVAAGLQRLFGNSESFERAVPPPEKHLREKDLFQGVI
jgi:hypothetical protein